VVAVATKREPNAAEMSAYGGGWDRRSHRKSWRPVRRRSSCCVRDAALAPAPPVMQCWVIAIDGPGGAGRSTLAARVAQALDVQIVCTDEFASWDRPLEWWRRMIEQVLAPYLATNPAGIDVGTAPGGSWHTGELAVQARGRRGLELQRT
jgi:hypothetical protein